jgi:hypothetical protein
MRKSFLLVLFMLLSLRPNALAKTCTDDSISSVSSEGDIIKMLSGSVWEIDDVDQVDSQLWLPTEDVLICSETLADKGKAVTMYTIIDTDSDNEKVGAQRLR